ncbi:hypothetical protein F2Q69_00022563 [Brassica cretica]|uniref:Uncharacterized protein n=1 Tax=Brassica cretica TaxID=69181 RepID=A0A8S9QLX0_BRACR|nr:hypothetical protein F2Q69_00022563 [Brassica cretica]
MDVEVVSLVDVEVVPSIDVKVIASVDVEVVQSVDVEVMPSVDIEVVPSGDVEVVPSVDIEVVPSIDVEFMTSVDVEVVPLILSAAVSEKFVEEGISHVIPVMSIDGVVLLSIDDAWRVSIDASLVDLRIVRESACSFFEGPRNPLFIVVPSTETIILLVGVENGYDEVNVQNPRRRKRKTFFDIYFFKVDSSLRKAVRRKHETSDKSSKRVATQRPSRMDARLARSLCSDRALPKRQYDISPCILVYPSMLSPEDRSEPVSRFLPF